jgi:Fe-S-cluster containining protein
MIFYGMEEEQLRKIAPGETPVVEYRDKLDLQNRRQRVMQRRGDTTQWEAGKTTIYTFSRSDDSKDVVMDGPCPNLDPDTLTCAIYDDRPPHCKSMEVGSDDCNDCRVSLGLPDIYIPLNTGR